MAERSPPKRHESSFPKRELLVLPQERYPWCICGGLKAPVNKREPDGTWKTLAMRCINCGLEYQENNDE